MDELDLHAVGSDPAGDLGEVAGQRRASRPVPRGRHAAARRASAAGLRFSARSDVTSGVACSTIWNPGSSWRPTASMVVTDLMSSRRSAGSFSRWRAIAAVIDPNNARSDSCPSARPAYWSSISVEVARQLHDVHRAQRRGDC